MTLWILTSLSSSVAADTASCEYKEQHSLVFVFSPFYIQSGSSRVWTRFIRCLLSACISPAVASEPQTMQ